MTRTDRWQDAFFLAAAAIALGNAVHIANGFLDPEAITYLSWAFVFCALAVLMPRVKWLGLACAAGIVALIGYHRTTSFVGGPGQALGYTVVALFYACVLVWVLASTETGIASRLFTQGWLTTLGKYSYALYLFHMAIHRLVREYVYGPDDFHTLGGSRLPGQIVFYFICASLSFVAAVLSWHGVERHFLKLKVLFPTRRDEFRARPAQRLVPATV